MAGTGPAMTPVMIVGSGSNHQLRRPEPHHRHVARIVVGHVAAKVLLRLTRKSTMWLRSA